MRKIIFVLGLCFLNVYAFSQRGTYLILKYRGLQDEALVSEFVRVCTANDNSDENRGRAYDYYYAHEEEIIAEYDAACFLQYLERLSEVRAANWAAANRAINEMSAQFVQIAANYREQRELEKQQEQEIKMQQRAEMEARMANSTDRRPSSQSTSIYKIQSSGIQNSPYYAQGSYNDLLTSDPNWNKQVQMWVQQYGVEKTREMVRQRRANDYSQQAQVEQSYNERVSQSQNERIISAVTSNRQQINIKVRGNSVVAYSNGLNQLGQQNWQSVISVFATRCGIGTPYDDGALSREFSYTAQVNGIRIYFNM